MANPAFMEGIAAAKVGLSIKDNPYRMGLKFDGADLHTAHLWDLGLAFQLEKMSDV